ncbi:MAG: hemolysin family protein, partial [Candidatus Altarchaeaceae archaeon]
SALAAGIAIEIFGNLGVVIATGIMTFLILNFGDIIPYNYALRNEKFILKYSPLLLKISKILSPISSFFDKQNLFLMKIFGLEKHKTLEVTKEELDIITKIGAENGKILKDEQKMISGVLKFNDKNVDEIMVHRTNIEGININLSDEEITKIIERTPYSRLPVYKDTIDNIIGILPVDEILRKNIKNSGVINFKDQKLIQPYFVPKNMKINRLFREMKEKNIKMAIVVDEYGGTAGLVTMDDLIEEITGDIPEEWELNETIKIDENSAIFPGDTEIYNVGIYFNDEIIPDGNYRTIAGCFLTKLERIPNKNESVILKGQNFIYKFIVTELMQGKILKVRVIKMKNIN